MLGLAMEKGADHSSSNNSFNKSAVMRRSSSDKLHLFGYIKLE
jgi:hypothetical protein